MEDAMMVIKSLAIGAVVLVAVVIIVPLALGAWAFSNYDDNEVYIHG